MSPIAPTPSSNGQTKAAKPIAKRASRLPGEEKPLGKDPNLIETIQRDIATIGMVNEQDNSLLTYVAYSSRLLSDPASIISRGRSTAGKTSLLTRVASLFPDDVKIEAMMMTPASLFNSPEDYLQHKILMSGERKHSQDDVTRDANALLRQLLSEKRISRAVSVYNSNAMKWNTEYIVREGPIAYAESTTSGSIFEEDLNRMLQVYVDDSQPQTRAIMHAIGSRYAPDNKPVDVDAIVQRHHEFQKSLQSCDVRIPYWEQLIKGMPSAKIECRRVVQQVLTVIEALVLLQQHSRKQTKGGFLLATLDDYAIARRLLLGPVHAAVGVGQAYKNADRLKSKLSLKVFTARDVKDALKYKSDMGPSHLLNGLVKAGLLVRVTKKNGSTGATYTWQKNLESLVLPTVGSLRSQLTT